MKRTTTMIVALALMSGTAAIAAPGSQGQDGQQPACGQPDQPACETLEQKGNPEGKSEDRNRKGKGKGQQSQTPGDPAAPPSGGPQGQQPNGVQGPAPGTQATPPAGGPKGQPPGGPQGQPPGGSQGQTPGGAQGSHPGWGQQGQPSRGPQQPGGPGSQGQYGPPQGERSGPPGDARWSRGERVPQQYRQDQYYVQDWQRNNLSPPPRGYRWMCYERGNCFLVQNDNGVILRAFRRDDRDNFWRRRYARTYTYNDDLYYRECRSRPDPAGILVGGLIGGLIGRSLGDERAGPTFAGIIVGGTLGAAFTRDLDCDDRSYAYHSYYDAFNGGRVGRVYAWRNPRNNYRGAFVVRSYYYDEDGFRCARYRHTIWTPRRRQMDGYACRQPDGAWLFLR